MAEFTSYPPGTPCWIDAALPDLAAAREFYTSVFGWDYEEGPPETGGYVRATLRGRSVAGIFPLSPEMREQGMPPVWTTYFATDDADGLVKRAQQAGGEILASPMAVLDMGSMAIIRDAAGAVFGLWQAREFSGAQIANESGSLIWSELLTRDREKARAFYADVFGYETEDVDMGGGDPYVLFKVDGHEIGGTMTMPEQVPADVPAHWLAYFAVDDTDAACERISSGGGRVMNGPMDSPYGRLAVVSDPFGAPFTVIQAPASQEG